MKSFAGKCRLVQIDANTIVGYLQYGCLQSYLFMTFHQLKKYFFCDISGAKLLEEFEITALFHIPKKYPCSYAFAQMELAKKELLIDDYSITQTSLEQVI